MGSNDRSFSFFISFFLHREVIHTTKYDSRRAQKERTVYRYTLEMIEGGEERGEARVPVEYKDTQSSRKKGGGMQQDGETYRKDPPPLFHRNGVRHPLSPPFPSLSFIVLVVVVVVIVVVSSLRLESLSLFPSLSHPRSICLAPSEPPSHSFLRIRSSPSISRPLLFLLSICALSGRFEAR